MNSVVFGRGLIGFLFAIGILPLRAQIPQDSIPLREVSVRGISPERYMAGMFVQVLDSANLRSFATQRLDQLLAQTTSLAFRTYGNGQMSTVSFRGLSPNHTALLWNGVNINLPSVGQTDFSSIPVAAFDKVTLQYGAGATQLGTDAVGGGIALESVPMSGGGVSAGAGMEYGSFGNRSLQAKARYGRKIDENWSFAGKTQWNSLAYPNNFPQQYFKGRRIELSNTFQKSFLQDLFLHNKKGHSISAHLWVNEHRITLWPEVVSSRELTEIFNVRTMVKYSAGKWRLHGAFVRDHIHYGTGSYAVVDRSRTDRLSVKGDREWRGHREKWSWSVLVGAEGSQFLARVNGYGRSDVREFRGDAFVLTRIEHVSGVSGSVNLRQAFAQGYSVPFTPSVGMEYPLYKAASYRMTVSANLARSYRVPTLNERYWKDIGDPNMQPESGANKEIGVAQNGSFGNWKWQSRLNFFHNKVKNWIYWDPAKNYRAENLQMVVARGMEFHNEWTWSWDRWRGGLSNRTGFTRSTQEKTYDVYSKDLLGKQLRFTPVWLSNTNVFLRYRKSEVMLQHHYESVRYITFDNRQFLPAYSLVHLVLEQGIKPFGISAQLQGRVSNLTNQLYLNVKSYAMPGRMYHLRLLIDYQL